MSVFNPGGRPPGLPLYFERDSRELGGDIVAARHDSIGLRERIKRFGCVGAVVGCGMRLLARILGSNGCKAFLFRHRSRQVKQVEKTLLPGLAEAFLRKKESKRFWAHEEQYLESILDVEAKLKQRNLDLQV
jgi:hypothetical protein